MFIITLNSLNEKGLMNNVIKVLGVDILLEDWDDEIEITKRQAIEIGLAREEDFGL